MKINRDARQAAKKLYRACLVNDQLDENRVRQAVQAVAEKKPRNYLPILARLKKLVEIEVERKTAMVQSATPLPDQGASIFEEIGRRFSPPLKSSYATKPELIGGLRIQFGSNVWDGSVRERLNLLEQSLN